MNDIQIGKPAVKKSEFDHYADQYLALHTNNIRISGEEPAYFADYKVRETRRVLGGEMVKTILDFGVGIGASTPFFRRYFPEAELTGIDVSADSLAIAERSYTNLARFVLYDGSRIPANNDHYDLVFTACVFHHIPPIDHVATLAEIRRVLKPGGAFLIFEHNPLNPITRYAVNTCPFDENAILIGAREMRRRILAAGFSAAQINYCVFFPAGLALFRRFEKHLWWLPIGAQYFVRATR